MRFNDICLKIKSLTRLFIVCAINFTGDKISDIHYFGTLVKQYTNPQKLVIRKPFAVFHRLAQIPAF